MSSVPEGCRGCIHSRDPETGLKRMGGQVILDPTTGAEVPFFCLGQTHPGLAENLETLIREQEQKLGFAVQCEFLLNGDDILLKGVSELNCSPSARLRILLDLVEEGVLSGKQAVQSLNPADLIPTQTVSRRERRQAAKNGRIVTEGCGTLPIVVQGRIATDATSAWGLRSQGHGVLLLLKELTLEAKDALTVCDGLLVAEEPPKGLTDKPCLVVTDLETLSWSRSETYSLDGSAGLLLRGSFETEEAPNRKHLSVIQNWITNLSGSKVRGILSSLKERDQLAELGLGRVGLCRLELFFESTERVKLLWRSLEAAIDGDSEGLNKFVEAVTEDLVQLLECIAEQPNGILTLRLFDAPMGKMLRLWTTYLEVGVEQLHPFLRNLLLEKNSTQGLRGGRFSILHLPFLRAQFLAAANAVKSLEGRVDLQIMLPGISTEEEVQFCRAEADAVFSEVGLPKPTLGMMLETPRACLLADRFTEDCDFFSFGTGDLTEATYSWSRYEATLSYLPQLSKRIGLAKSPFHTLDQSGVGALMRLACQKLRAARPEVEIGWCGSQAAHHLDLNFLEELTLDYVSVPLPQLNWARANFAAKA